jgi:hypothetical protein|tara:strand:+ start:1170 stop:1463 length:294 start_codon:yes stop_codon:yes gene_type:complete
MRYKAIPTKSDASGKRVVSTSILPKIRKRDSDTFVLMVEKTRFDHLAHRFYNNPSYWWILAAANEVHGTMYAKLGSQIRIPRDINSIIDEYNRINGL